MPRDLDAPYVFVDPGKHASGVAWYSYGQLYKAEYRPCDRPLDPFDSARLGCLCVCEKPRVRSEYEQKRDGVRIRSADIEDLLIAAGRMTSALPTEYVSVSSWKGAASKGSMHARMLTVLSENELAILSAGLDGVSKRLHHNVYDAVCMGLKWLGRWR